MPKAGVNPTTFLTTTISLPRFPLEHRCGICRIFHTRPELYDELTVKLLEGRPRKQIIAWLAKQNVRTGDEQLSRHYHRHMLPYFTEALEIERRLQIEMQNIGSTSPATVASALTRSLAMRALTAAATINFEQLGKDADAKTVEALSKLGQSIATIDHLAIQARIAEKMLALKEIELLRKQGDLDALAARYLRMKLKDHPNLAQHIITVLELEKHDAAAVLPEVADPKPAAARKKARSR